MSAVVRGEREVVYYNEGWCCGRNRAGRPSAPFTGPSQMRRNQSAGLDRRFQGPPSAVRHLPHLPNGTLAMQERRAYNSSTAICGLCASSVFWYQQTARGPRTSLVVPCQMTASTEQAPVAPGQWASFARFASVPRRTAPLHGSDLGGASQHCLAPVPQRQA